MCHELNLFLKKRDPQFFESVVKSFLSCKLEKTFVDFYLLGDYAQAIKYAEFHLNGKLNAMEQCLLVESCVKAGKRDLAKEIAGKLKLQVEALTNNNMSSRVSYENKIFDLVLNLNNLNDIKGGLEKIKENAIVQ